MHFIYFAFFFLCGFKKAACLEVQKHEKHCLCLNWQPIPYTVILLIRLCR